ncbi:hypothetical protein, partial [Halorubrum sp. FL23]|uniref:hypothetical protein n=1 Tax=Halorubrum sp. FL23 TaxID=3458704 RepID=UPI004034F23C
AMNSTHSDSPDSVADLPAGHRDLLWVLSQMGPSESLPLKRALSNYYTDGIDSSRLYTILTELVENDLVIEHTRDHYLNEYRLTETVRRALSVRQAWQAGSGDDTTVGGRN